MGNGASKLWKPKFYRDQKDKIKKSYDWERTQNELWQEYYAPFMHFLPFEELCSRLETNLEEGLTEEVATTKLKRYGKNTLPFPPKHKLLLIRYLQSCFSVMGFIILMGSLACFYLHVRVRETHPKYISAGWILLIIFFIIGLFPLLYEEDDEELLAAIDNTTPMYCTVIREGKKEIILAQDVVLGDIVPISYGQRIPADVRFFSCLGLEVDNVALTGCSEPWQVFLLPNDEKQLLSYSKIESFKD